MWPSVKENAASLNTVNESGTSGYNLARGLRAVYSGSAFLPAFVLEECRVALDDNGFDFVRKCVEAIEEKGMREQGLYRNCGVTSKVQKLLQVGMDKRRSLNEKLSVFDDEWEIKTLSSALKTFLRNLPEPLMTFELHPHFINAAKMDSKTRVSCIHYFVYKLPQLHFEMLQIIIEHLRKVADRSSENLMTVGNLGVCFGPTLLRPKEETMAAIMDIKFCNVVVEVLIANYDLIFKNKPMDIDSIPCPPKPSHQDEITGSSSLFDETVPFLKQQTLSMVQEEKKSQAEESLNTSKRPHNIFSSTTHQRPPPIYDRIARSYVNDNGTSENASSHVVMAYGKPSTSAGTSPVAPTVSSSLTCSGSAFIQGTAAAKSQIKRPLHTALADQSRNATNQEIRLHEGKTCAESSESLNSAASSSDPSLSSNEQNLHLTNFVQDRESSAKAKLNISYAPAYNPFSSECSVTAPISVCGISHCRSRYKMSSSLPISHHHHRHRGPIALRTVGGDTVDAVGNGSFLSDLRVSSLFTYVHPFGTLQPSRRVKTLYECIAGHDTELSFQPGQIITNVYESKEEGWLVGTLNGKTGLIPANYVEPLP